MGYQDTSEASQIHIQRLESCLIRKMLPELDCVFEDAIDLCRLIVLQLTSAFDENHHNWVNGFGLPA